MPTSKTKIPFEYEGNGRILYKIYHDVALDRTMAILYIYLPEKYKLLEKSIENKPKKSRNSNAMRNAIKSAVNDYNVSNQDKDDLKAALSGVVPLPPVVNSKTTIQFQIFPEEHALGGTSYRQYIFDGKDAKVTVQLDPAPGLDLGVHTVLNDYKGIVIT